MTVVTPRLLREWPLDVPEDGAGKHARGTVHVVGGDRSTPGAVLLAGLAALRVGAGRLQVTTVPDTSVALGVALPEAMVTGVDDLRTADVDGCEAVVLGPGVLDKDAAREVLAALLLEVTGAVVLDAVALPALAGSPDLLAPVATRAVLTPNPGELAALLDGEDLDGSSAALHVAERYAAVVATQGLVAAPDGRLWEDGTGTIGLGTSGSGDVLAGAVAGLLARGADPCQAAVWGQYLHASAGERLGAGHARIGYLARELLDELPGALAALTA